MLLFHHAPISTDPAPSRPTDSDPKKHLSDTAATKSTLENAQQRQTLAHHSVSLQREIGVQTAKREAYTQTDPYTPREVVAPGGRGPEVLRLKHFRWGHELPPTIAELVFIEEQRQKQMFDLALPPISDEFCFQLRRRLMEEQEIFEWEQKENALKKAQNKRLNLLQNALLERERATEQANYARVAAVKNGLNTQKNTLVAALQNRRVKALRKLVKVEREFEALRSKRTIIDDYQNFGSAVYASVMRNGFSLERFSERFKTDFRALSDYEVFREFLGALDPGCRTVKVSLDDLMASAARKYLKLEKHQLQQLQRAQEELNNRRAHRFGRDLEDMYDLNIQNVVPRPDTPFHEGRSELAGYPHQEVNLDRARMQAEEERIAGSDRRHLLATLLQRLLRGRAIQNIMFDGKEKRLALIDELLIVANTQAKDESEELEIARRAREAEQSRAQEDAVQGRVIAETLDTLNRELLRHVEEQKLKAFVERAEEERRRLEVAETGRRQAELTIKSREERLYAGMIEVHQQTAEELLDDVFGSSSDFLAKKEAVHLTDIKEQKFLNYVEMNNANYEVLVNDFLHCFLVPNIDRERLRQSARDNDRRSFERLMGDGSGEYSP